MQIVQKPSLKTWLGTQRQPELSDKGSKMLLEKKEVVNMSDTRH